MTVMVARTLSERNQPGIAVAETASNRRDNDLLIGKRRMNDGFAEFRAHLSRRDGAWISMPLAHAGAGRGLNLSIRLRISANSGRGTATSASWNVT